MMNRVKTTLEYNNPATNYSISPRTNSLPLSEYPSGSYFNDFGNSPCTCHYDNCNLDGSCDCKAYAGGIQCFAFAHYAFEEYNGVTCNTNNANGSLATITAQALENYLSDLSIGTHVRYKGASSPHSFIIMGHTSNGIKVYEANWKSGCEVGTRTVSYTTLATQIKSITNSWSA